MRARDSHVAVERQPAPWTVVVRELDPVTMTGPACLCGAGVADEHQLRRDVQRPHNSVDWRCGIATDRRPSSVPFARTSGVTRSTGCPVAGSRVIVAPRASLLWKPSPAFAYSSVPPNGPITRPPLGLTRPARATPPFAGSLAVTLKR